MAKTRWYNPLTWRMFGYNDPKTGDFVEVDMAVGGKQTQSGERITPKRAVTVPIIWTCIKILSESVGGLPAPLYVEQTGQKAKGGSALERRVLRLLRKPNPSMTRLTFLKAAVVNMGLVGNSYNLIERNAQGEWIGLTPLPWDAVEIDTETLDLLYWVTLNGQRFPVAPENMLHFKLFSADGICGLSPVEFQAESMGLAKAGQNWSARFMRKGGFTGGYVIYDQFLTKEQQQQVMAKFPDVRQGDAADIGKIAILQGGPKLVPAGLSQKDSQFIESQQFQEEALAGIWGVPLWLANRASKTSIMGSNLEQQKSAFVTFGLKPYIDAIEDEINDKLLSKLGLFLEFVVEGLLRAD
ncbi:phage portal protein, partial [Achromobacter marplatensis]|uniref:phage portal protein n=1 Tax=Achromobacter marplatensis TaxID=470868 RepID=UPI000277E923